MGGGGGGEDSRKIAWGLGGWELLIFLYWGSGVRGCWLIQGVVVSCLEIAIQGGRGAVEGGGELEFFLVEDVM